MPIEFYTLEPHREHIFFSDRDQLIAALEKPQSVFDAFATAGDNQNLPVSDIFQGGSLQHPRSVTQNTEYDNAFYERNFWRPKQNIITRLRFKIIEIAVQYESLKKIYRFLLGKKK